ncbi:MAG TPA: hypothetical protein VGJ91_09545 [Polyangiaceae bacterium]|jgi:predicted GH43/DUF377 family glycosyl hydrolase
MLGMVLAACSADAGPNAAAGTDTAGSSGSSAAAGKGGASNAAAGGNGRAGANNPAGGGETASSPAGSGGRPGNSAGSSGNPAGNSGLGTSGNGSGGANSSGGNSSTAGMPNTACPANPPTGLPDGPLVRASTNPIIRNGPETYDTDKAGPRVVWKPAAGDYRMLYEAVSAAASTTYVAYATSTDGLTWTKKGPVMSPSETWEGNEVSPQSLLLEQGVYKLWYHGGGNTQANRNIGYATSADGLTWTKHGAPVLMVGASGSFDDDETAEPRVFALSSGGYRMYYTGANQAARKSLGVATSTDGVAWTKRAGNPILDSNRWGNFWGGAFFQEGNLWHLWHAIEGGNGSLAYMWSKDGIAWTDGAQNPVLLPASTANGPDTQFVGDSVSGFRDGAEYRIFYTGFATNLFGTMGRFEGICMAHVAATCP